MIRLLTKISAQLLTIPSKAFATKPSNAFLLFFIGFFFTQFMLVNMLYIKQPFGGWVTSIGTFTTSALLFASLLALSVCLIALWRTVAKQESLKDQRVMKGSIVKTRNSYSPIDYPKGSTTAVVSAYALG